MENTNKTIEDIKQNRYRNFQEKYKKLFNYLLSKWLIILVIGLSGGASGLILSLVKKPTYNARIGFILIDNSSAAGGFGNLASTLGLGNLFSSGSSNVFSGDNLLEIIQSRYALEKALLTPMVYENQQMTMIDAYLQINNLHEKWKNKKNIELQTLSYPIDQDRVTFSRTQDSIMHNITNKFLKKEELVVFKKDKNKGLVYVDFKSKNEVFSKEFAENLIDQTIQFYIDSKTKQSKTNIEMMQHTADSIKLLYDAALYSSAAISQVNINKAYQTAAVPKVQQESNAQLYGTVYAEVLKNLETLKLDLARETPIIQIVESPRYPLKTNKIGKIKGIAVGGFLGGVLIIIILLFRNLKLFEFFIKLFL